MQQKHGTLLPKCDFDETEHKRSDHQTVEHIKLEPEQGNDDDRNRDYDCMDYEEAERAIDDSVDTDEPSNESEEDSSYTTKTTLNKSTIKPAKRKKLETQRVIETALAEIAKYITAKCDKCADAENAPVLTTLEHANEHHRTIHDQPGYLICCDKRLSTKQQLKQHLTWHKDQNKFK